MNRTASRFLTLSVALTIAGCAASASSPSPDAATTDGAGNDHAIADTAPGADSADSAGTACSNPPNLTAAAPTCNTVVNSAHAVAFTARTGAPPAATGGAILDGVYVSTAAEGYGAVTPAGRRITIVVLGGATQMLWTGEVLDAAGATVTLSFTANAHVVASGNQLTFSADCSSNSPSPLPPALTYTATANQLIVSLTKGADSSVTTYTRTGCP